MTFSLKRDSIKFVSLVLFMIFMTVFDQWGYVFIDGVINFIWSVLFVVLVINSSLKIRHMNNDMMIRLYFISYGLMIIVWGLSPEITNVFHVLSLLLAILFYQFKKNPVLNRIMIMIPVGFFSVILILFLMVNTSGFTRKTVISEIKNGTGNQTLILEYHDLGATGANYTLILQQNIIDQVLITRKVQINDMDRKPEKIRWIDSERYFIDGVEFRLK